MMKLVSKYLIITFVLYPFICHSQAKGDYVWELGPSSNNVQNPFAGSIEMNFNNDSLAIDTLFRYLFMDYFNTSISDEEGELLLYSNGCQVRNGRHEFINGSNNLNPGDIDTEWCTQGGAGYPIFEGGIFLPFNNDSIIELFHQRLIILGQPLRIYIDTLFYSQFVKNNDTYTLVKKSIPVIGDTLFEGNLEAVKTSDDKGWWLIQQVQNSNKYYVVRVSQKEKDTIIIQNIGDLVSTKSPSQSVFSPDGTMYARFNPKDQLYLFNFNRNTGELSNYRKIFVIDTNDYSGIAFSSNSRFLYACTTKDVFQFDTQKDDIESSKVHIGHYDGYADPFPAKFFLMQLGPDCRIYICTTNGNKAWHVIQEPDQEGLACRFEQHAIHFPVSNSITMPNFPVFRVNPDQPCDPDIVSGYNIIYEQSPDVEIYPNPTHSDLYFNFGADWSPDSEIIVTIFDQIGQVLKHDRLVSDEGTQHIDISDLPLGAFVIEFKSNNHLLIKLGIRL